MTWMMTSQITACFPKPETARTLKRHVRQDDLDIMLREAGSPKSKKDIKTRQHLMERSFARATRNPTASPNP